MKPPRLTRRRFVLTLGALGAILIASIVACAFIGSAALPLGEFVRALLHPTEGGTAHDILFGHRIPRVLLAAIVGASLGTAGVVFQALLRNPLGDPYILGVSGGAALGAILALSFGTTLSGFSSVPAAAFLGAILTMFAIYWMAGVRGRLVTTNLLLTGVVFNAFTAAIIIFISSVVDQKRANQIFLWLIGDLRSAFVDYSHLLLIAVYLLAGIVLLLSMGRKLNLLSLGEESAKSLGVEVEWVKRAAFLSTGLMIGAAVSVSGIIGFVGLVVPHMLRLLLGADHRLLIPCAALFGGTFLIWADAIARTVVAPTQLPVGAITAIVGGPFFVYLLRKHYRKAYFA